MTRHSIFIITVLIVAEAASSMPALARGGGGGGFMQSFGYQRRLQESRGQVTNQSSSVQPYTQPPAVYPRRPVKRQQGN